MTDHEHNLPLDEPTDDPLELAVRAMKQQPIPAGPPADLIAATLKSLESRELNARPTILSIPRSRMMKILKAGSGLVLAGCVAIAVLTLRSPASAYSQLIEQARKAKSMTYVTTITSPELPQPAVVRVSVAEDGRSRTEHMFNGKPSGTVTIDDAAGYARVILTDASVMAPPRIAHLSVMQRKTAMIYPAREGQYPVQGGHKNSFLRSLQSLKDKPDRELGNKTLEGKKVRGFEATYGTMKFSIWVDVATGRLVQIEYDSQPNSQHVTMTEFQFDEQLDESLFSFEAPAGYEVRNMELAPAAAGGEESLLIVLQSFAEKSGGEFPKNLTSFREMNDLFSKGNTTGVPDKESKRFFANFGALTPFLFGLDKADYAYRGAGKTTRDKDAIIFWYKKKDGVYRAVYGDLSVKDIPEEQVPRD